MGSLSAYCKGEILSEHLWIRTSNDLSLNYIQGKPPNMLCSNGSQTLIVPTPAPL